MFLLNQRSLQLLEKVEVAFYFWKEVVYTVFVVLQVSIDSLLLNHLRIQFLVQFIKEDVLEIDINDETHHGSEYFSIHSADVLLQIEHYFGLIKYHIQDHIDLTIDEVQVVQS